MRKRADAANIRAILLNTQLGKTMQEERTPAPNYTTACIAMFGVNIAWIFFAIWAIWGLIAVAATGWAVNRAISYIGARR